jgi:hypothetical protein
VYLRLRQLCLVARDLEAVVADLQAVFDLEVCHRDPAVERFGLHNALLRIGTSFVEVVAPLREGTAAGRYLERRGGDGGYMVILDAPRLVPWRRHVALCGVRIAAALKVDSYEGLQLHPHDTGGALLEINRTEAGEALLGAYWPAGPHWQQRSAGRNARAITGAVLQSADPRRLARRWAEILRRHALRAGAGFELELDNARLGFVEALDGRGEGLAGIEIEAADPARIVDAARARGCLDAGAVIVGGVRWAVKEQGAAPVAGAETPGGVSLA